MPTKTANLNLETLWSKLNFGPTGEQKEAIFHEEGPLFLQAGPGSGKTRVLLWRTLNLIVNRGVSPGEIFLATFTEKAALQLQEGLRSLLNIASNITNSPYDISKMYIGTVHSLCLNMLSDRRFSPGRTRPEIPILYDDLLQYFHVGRANFWENISTNKALLPEPNEAITELLDTRTSKSKHKAVEAVINLFNRISEEGLEPDEMLSKTKEPRLKALLAIYKEYVKGLKDNKVTDFSHVQHEALDILKGNPSAGKIFKHVIIDEYQDTNPIQESLFFALSAGHKNLCVVGDDDQSLYRFRGATVENFVNFPERCGLFLKAKPRSIFLVNNFRSLPKIVDIYNEFISVGKWTQGKKKYRLDKNITPNRKGAKIPAVVASNPGSPDDVVDEIAETVHQLIRTKKVSDPNQIAFLYPSLKSPQVPRMKKALEKKGYQVYAPRAGRFLETPEAQAIFGAFLHVLGLPARDDTYDRGEYKEFHDWIKECHSEAGEFIKKDDQFKEYVKNLKVQISTGINDYDALLNQIEKNKWELDSKFDISMRTTLINAPGLSKTTKVKLSGQGLEKNFNTRTKAGIPTTFRYVLNRVTAFDWDLLDLFYRFCGFEYFKKMFDLAESGKDEGPICNLSLISNYIETFMDMSNSFVIAPAWLKDGNFANYFFGHYLYVLYRKGESEYEDANDPFPRGRIPFITIHQSKGLEFPVVVLANPRKNESLQPLEALIQPFIKRHSEPEDLIPHFDVMRMFYVALSRAENLLIIAHYKGQGQSVHDAFRQFLENPKFPRINKAFLDTIPAAEKPKNDLPVSYSYTMDYLGYQKCPRNYMIFRKYGFTPSRSQTAFFGSLVHQTLEDLHNHLISKRANN